MSYDLRSSNLQHTFIKDRISDVEKHFYEISSKLATYNKKQALMRDAGFDFVKSIERFVSKETLNNSLRGSVLQFADLLRAIQEYRDAQIQRTDAKIILELRSYDANCKRTKADLKRNFDIRTKEFNKKHQLEKTRSKNGTNWPKVSQAEIELTKAKDDATRSMVELSKTIDNFEKQKLEDLKHAFLEYIKIELIFHAKALELYTSSYNIIKNINVDEDLKEFRDHFKSYTPPVDYNLFPSSEIKGTPGPSTACHNPTDPKSTFPAAMEQNLADASNTSLKSCSALSKSSADTSDSSFKVQLSRKLKGSSKINELTNKSGHFKADNSSEVGSSGVESKFDFGDQCL